MIALELLDQNKSRGVCRSTLVVNVVYKRSWSEIFTTKKSKEGKILRMKGEACGK